MSPNEINKFYFLQYKFDFEMNHSKIASILLIMGFLIIAQALHLQKTQNSQLIALVDQQKNIGQQVDNLLQNADSVKQQIQTASNSSQKVNILQEAIDKQKQQIFDLKNTLVPPFNQSSTACKQLTQTQKNNLLLKIKGSRQKLAKLQQINNNLNQDLLQVQKINSSISNQMVILQSMQQTIQKKCKLSPTIFQSNLKAPNWILGAQTMSTLQDQYASRALLFSNITNCPIQTPFYSATQQLCVQCFKPTPFWNMFTKECIACGIDEEIDNKTKNCKVKPHYTNFTKVLNWNLEGGELPTIDLKLMPCQDTKPYFNGIICTKCQLPKYWSVSANLCKKCSDGFTFDMNTRQCQKIIPSQLTILQNTTWITKNLTRVIQQRVNALNQNQTSGKYIYCQDISKPFFDGATCITCQYYDMDTKKCTLLPKNTVYNWNMRQFVAPQAGKQTNINATRYISSNNISDTNLPNCNDTHQFYDSIACIQCARPFDIFSIDDSKCIACNSNQIFIQSNHTCTQRKTIYVSQNFDRLMATPKVTIPKYKQSIVALINSNTEAIIVPCKDKQYSSISACFNCQDNQYFNVQLLKCVQCDGTYNQKTNICNGTIYIFTNLKAQNIIDMQGLTVDQQNQRVNDFISTHSGSYICPIDKPYAIENKTCGTCEWLFSYSSLKCTSCEQYEVYVGANKDCQQATMLVNFTDSHLILVTANQTLSSFKLAQQQIANQNSSLAKICPGSTPYTSDRMTCYNCSSDSPYFNYTTKQCVNCPDSFVFDAVQVRCVQKYFITLVNNQTVKQMIGSNDYTIDNYVQDQNKLKNNVPFQLCTGDTPFGTTSGCQQCADPTLYFDIKKSVCSSANKIINFSSIGPNYTIAQGKTLSNYQNSQNNYKLSSQSLVIQCSKETPFTNDHSTCFSCTDPTYLFDLQTKSCIACDSTETFKSDQNKCVKLAYITNFNDVTKMVGSSTYTLNDYKTDQNNLKLEGPYILCNTTEPFGSTVGCIQCTVPQQYFDIKNKICTQIKWYTNFNASNSSFITGVNKTIQDYQQSQTSQISSSNIPTLICPLTTAFTSDGKTCINCSQTKGRFNLQTNQCETCDSTSKYDSSTNKCIKTQYYTLFTPTAQSKILVSSNSSLQNYKDNQTNIQNSVGSSQCTAATPYATSTGCITCGVGLYFDVNSQTCVTCPTGTQFLPTQNMCQSVAYLTNYSNPFIKVSNNYSLEKAKQVELDRTTGKFAVNCTDSKPYATQTGCISCASPLQYFNIQSMTCEKGCIEFYQYFKNNMCRDYIVLTNTKNMHGINEVNNYTKYNVQKMNNFTYIKNQPYVIDCPAQKPFYTGSLCIACTPSAPIFNLQSLSCQSASTILKTNITSIKYYIQQPGYTLQDEKDQINYLKKMNVPVTYCPSVRPYLSNTECINCPDDAKYFDFAEEICQDCLPGLVCKSL